MSESNATDLIPTEEQLKESLDVHLVRLDYNTALRVLGTTKTNEYKLRDGVMAKNYTTGDGKVTEVRYEGNRTRRQYYSIGALNLRGEWERHHILVDEKKFNSWEFV